MQKYINIILGLALMAGACTKISDEPQFDLTPAIVIDSISADTIVEFEEALIVTLTYEDGDGDLGNPDPNVNSLFVKDQRLEMQDEYYVYPLAPVGENISITGKLTVELNTTFILGNGTAEQTKFTLYLVDRAGNKSNEVTTGFITIVKP